jgi:hypothetical protein
MTAWRASSTASLIGLAALAVSALYLASDVIEALQGGFSGGQLGLTRIAEAAIPVFVIGLCLVQRPQIGRLGRLSAVAYAYSHVFFTGTVVYALIDGTSDSAALSPRPAAVNDDPRCRHGARWTWLRCRGDQGMILRAWTGIALMAGVVVVSLSQKLAEGGAGAGRRDPRPRIRRHGRRAAGGACPVGSTPGRVPGLARR